MSKGTQPGRGAREKRCDRYWGRRWTDRGRREDRLGKGTTWMGRPDLVGKGWGDRRGEETVAGGRAVGAFMGMRQGEMLDSWGLEGSLPPDRMGEDRMVSESVCAPDLKPEAL